MTGWRYVGHSRGQRGNGPVGLLAIVPRPAGEIESVAMGPFVAGGVI